MHIKISQYRLHYESVKNCLPAIEAYVAKVKATEPGVLAYASYRQPDGVSFTHVVAFRDGRAEIDHREAKHTRQFEDLLVPCCDIPPTFASGELVAST